MSRPSALRETLKLPQKVTLEVVSVQASGDCFYDCIHELLAQQYCSKNPSSSETLFLPPLLSSCHATPSATTATATAKKSDHGDDADSSNDKIISIPTSQSLRNYVANQLTSEQLDLYKMYATAGLEEYKPFSKISSLEDLKRFAKVSGRTNGPGKCFWADEFALRTLSDGLHLTLLIVDDQATRRGDGGLGRKRRRNGNGNGDSASSSSSSSVDNRFVFIGSYPRVVILHRSQRQHYNAIVIDGHPLMEFEQLPLDVQSLWPVNKINMNMAERKEPESFPSSKSDTGNDDGNGKENIIPEEDGKEVSNPLSSTTNLPTTKSMGTFFCGCAGFSSSSWVGNFYPKSIVGHNSERQLSWYQQQFRTVEINSTFYGIPTESTVSKWKKLFAKAFKVVMKAPKGLTHENSQLDCSVLSTFLSRMKPLDETLACILIQCPRTLIVTPAQLEEMKRMLDEEASWYRGRLAFEFRNEATYFNVEVRNFLKQNSFALVMHPNSLGRSTVGSSANGRGDCALLEYQPEQLSKVATTAGALSSSFVYIRLHGSNDEHRGEYTTDQLKEIAQQIHSWRTQGVEVFCFILNDLDATESPSSSSPQKSWCAMPKNAKQLESIVYGLSNEDVPDAPKKPKNTLHNFFRKKG